MVLTTCWEGGQSEGGGPAKPAAAARRHFRPRVLGGAPHALPCRVLGGKLATPARPDRGPAHAAGAPALGAGRPGAAVSPPWGQGASPGRDGAGRSLVQVVMLVLLQWVRGGGVQDHGEASERGVEERSLSVQKTTSPESCPLAVCRGVPATRTASEWPSAGPEDLVPWASSPCGGSHGPYIATPYTSGSASSPERHRKLLDVFASCPAPSMPGGHRTRTHTGRLVKTEGVLEPMMFLIRLRSTTPGKGRR